MIYSPQTNPRRALIVIAVIVTISIVGGIFIDKLFIVGGLLFWMQFTLVRVYIQASKGSKHDITGGVTEALLNPFVRFVLFEGIGVISIIAVLAYNNLFVGVAGLLAWLIAAINFYSYYMNLAVQNDPNVKIPEHKYIK